MCLSPYLGIGTVLMQCFTLGSSKIKLLKTYFFDIAIT